MNISFCSDKFISLLQTSKMVPVFFFTKRCKIVNISGIEISEKSFNEYISDIATISNE